MKIALLTLLVSSTVFADSNHWCGMPIMGLVGSDAYMINILDNGTLKLYSVYNGGFKLILKNELYTLIENNGRLIILHDNGANSFELDCDKLPM